MFFKNLHLHPISYRLIFLFKYKKRPTNIWVATRRKKGGRRREKKKEEKGEKIVYMEEYQCILPSDVERSNDETRSQRPPK